MMFQTFVVTALGLLCLHLHVTYGQQGQLGPCSRNLEQKLPGQCLQSKGIDYNGTLYIISANRTGSIPPGMTYTGFRNLMCSKAKQDEVTPCILKLMTDSNKTTCQEKDVQIMTARGTQFLALVEGFCGDPCEQTAMQTLIQCFAAVQVDPSIILNSNATIHTDKFPFVGNDSASATKFCNSRDRLFNCLSPLANDCPKILERLFILGVDLAGLERATQVLCLDLDTYLSTLKCFESPAFQQCDQEADLRFQKLQEDRYRTGQIKPSQYQGRLCQSKLSKVECEVKKLADGCAGPKAQMVSTFECTSLPTPCIGDVEIQRVYDSLCKKVTTPSPAVTKRPTPPKVPVNPDTGKPRGGDLPVDSAAMAVDDSSSRLGVLVCSAVVMLLKGRLMEC
ncbi:hypothetical protein ACOMHN_045598 [Nucella lapillus]